MTYHFNQMMNTIEGEWRGVETQIVHLGLDLSGFACTLVAELSEWYGIKVNFFPIGSCLSSTAGAMFPYWLCSCFTLAGVAKAASFPLWPQFHWESSPAAVVLSSSSPGLNDARPEAASLLPVSLTLFTASEKKIPSVGSVQSTLWMHRLFLSMTLKCPLLWGGLKQVGTFDDMWKESESEYGSSVM